MGQSTELNIGAPDPEAVYHEIVDAFRDSRPPSQYYQEDFEPYDEGARFDYLVDKSWLDVADDERYLAGHIEDEFFFMTKECFLYFLPGYLLGIIAHRQESTRGVTRSILGILSAYRQPWRLELLSYLLKKMTNAQKTAVMHWLQMQCERERSRELPSADRVTAFYCKAALTKWQELGVTPPVS